MSCDADQNAMKTASAATIATRGSVARDARSAMPAKRKTWHTIIHERLRPSTGRRYRSMSGAQRNLNVQGAWASEKSPMVLMSTPRYASQAGRAIQIRPSGRPDEKDWSVTAAIRREESAARRLAMAPGRARSPAVDPVISRSVA